jgi:hypothetical protein
MWGIFASSTFFWGDHRLKLAFTTCAFVLAALLTLSASFASPGDVVYRWKDEAGNPVNSDRPPPKGIQYETISTSSSMVHTVDTTTGAAPVEPKPQDDEAAEQADPTKPKVEKNPEYCQRAKDNLTALDSNVRIQMRNDKGEVHYLTMEERDAQRKQALNTIKVHCPASTKAH